MLPLQTLMSECVWQSVLPLPIFMELLLIIHVFILAPKVRTQKIAADSV